MAQATMTKKPSGPVRERSDNLEAAIAEHAEKNRLRTELMMRRAAGNPVEGDFELYAAHGLDQAQIKAELLRCERVLTYQRQAGTTAERAEGEALVKRCRDTLNEERPKIEAAIAELQTRRADLEKALLQAEQTAFRREQAVETLTKREGLLPRHIELAWLSKVKQMNADPRMVELRTKRARVRAIEPMLGWTVQDNRNQVNSYYTGRGDNDMLSLFVHGEWKALEAGWTAERAALKAECEAFEQTCGPLEEWEVARLAEVEALRNSLVDACG